MPARQILQTLKELETSPPRAKIIRSVTAFTAYWTPRHRLPIHSKNTLDKFTPLREAYKRRWEVRSDPLWWSSLVSLKTHSKRCVRVWLSRRVRVSLKNALVRHGFNSDGTPLAPGGTTLSGSLDLLVLPSCLTTSWKDLEIQTDTLIDQVLLEKRKIERKQSEKNNSNPFAGGPWRSAKK
jgi:hypothetical protein